MDAAVGSDERVRLKRSGCCSGKQNYKRNQSIEENTLKDPHCYSGGYVSCCELFWEWTVVR